MNVEKGLDFSSVTQPNSLLPPEIQNRPLDDRFSSWEKLVLSQRLCDLRDSFPECRLPYNQSFNLQKNATFVQYPDYEFTLMVRDKELCELFNGTGSIHIVGRAQTANEVLCVCNLLSLIRSHGRFPPVTYVTSYFPLQRGDRYQQQKLTVSNQQQVAFDKYIQDKDTANGSEVAFTEMMPLAELIARLGNLGTKRIIQIDSHSPVFSFLALKEGLHVVDLSAIPLMFRAGIEAGLFTHQEQYIPVVGDDGAREMGLLGKEILTDLGFDCTDLLQGEKVKTLTSKEVSFNEKELTAVKGRIAVIVEDIISTGGTMLETYVKLKAAGAKKVIILATYPIFAKEALNNLNLSDLFIITTDGRTPVKDISQASNIIQVPILKHLDTIAEFDQKNGNYWDPESQDYLRKLGFCLAPWQTHCDN
ncbi:hypothetical protein A2313_03160 [Candidatus Roizmanbacteria bacterium RIFOXYB2_FULL_41_10]|uniref:ribose-phosphate diphosphokinase n=1 Tax=Candidatus Roizmanbacteria bacterium RIFOXYA1_FULL_41_12 TaxID=1802082 RepID=A0A1F7K9V0_9BACT|nr:MAG: hypothetical protein A2262_02845 [Candidatus Roizmanbacteria bacterium RIFOXYA2_FULL_41_8]OGK64639.1 MAG: hypothetical protein A2209_03560 [Candidatus Roizmanbacteria bacterium RIFOXYA1_FULL_41_12]OGK67185.1 MAG: hypothetical protein A2377_00940 [Candidatus Roizmanbacteria bacterium RIFOXYB1_FULL_41_27]OGK71118.1 MAG: hypothetical protein A2403_02635 [Candidatus Roizmanbacteria bacterium RIFOXYC1_FULL_41_16]OGK72248.1 MAG: hypothetical protein A2313_03160 [Candidatus Roizmanbacteria bac